MVARLVRDEEAVGSNPVTRTSGVAPAGMPCTTPSFEGVLLLYSILMGAWRHRSCGAIFLKKFYYILWYEVELWKNPLLTFCKPLT